MKQLIHILLYSLLPLLISCGSKPVTPQASGKRHYRIGVSQCSSDDWRNKMNEEIEREILFHPEAEVEIRSAEDSNARQIADIRHFMDNGFDLIIAAPNEADAITPIIKQVYDKGIPVIIFDRNINGDSFTAWQGADNKSIGRDAAHYVARLHKESSGNGKIIELYGRNGSTPAMFRHEGFKNEMEKIPGIETVASAYADWNYEDALRVSDSLLHIYPDVEFIYAHNDRMAIAAAASAKKLGVSPKIIGIDAAPEIGIKAVKDSIITATFMYPTEGHRIIRTAINILDGKPYDRISMLPTSSAVDLSNADILLLQNNALIEETSKMQMLKSQVDEYWNRHSAQTILFYSAIAILLLLAALLFFSIRMYWNSKRHQIELLEQNQLLEKERNKQIFLNNELEKATQAKLLFFTNVSHDLRTPLTLISEPISQLREATNLTPSQHDMAQLAYKNVKILQRLITQILDFRKYESGNLQLHSSYFNLGEAARDWAESFRALAKKKDIDFSVYIDQENDLTIFADAEKLERVAFNLLSNAFKHTKSNGKVAFTCRRDDNMLEFSVSDTGEGIHPDQLPHIFERFYQADSVNPEGSGIGLALAKSFVDIHAGSISVESEPNKLTVFKVRIPISHDEKEIATTTTPPTLSEEDVLAEMSGVGNTQTEFDPEKPLLLLVEDNPDMRTLISGILGDEYNVACAADGKEGLRTATRYVPDLVITDVMMPIMNGMEFCTRLKNEISTSHIPVLMLTACTLDSQRIEGYTSGADGYLEKPFDAEMLRIRCRNLIENRRRVKNIWEASAVTSPATKEKDTTKGEQNKDTHPASDRRAGALSEVDNDFYRGFLAKVKERMADPDLSVDSLAADMGLGRSQFYRKIKALTNYSPVELLKKMRLQQARTLLTTTEKSISEIAYEVGFSTPAYFTRCFREAYGQTPSELRESLS
ncbi:MAG: substrate-binding domain-containing protein [Bacteroides sp.]|nr:substrate-binding domain-containing protein [Bacteroides sp.]